MRHPASQTRRRRARSAAAVTVAALVMAVSATTASADGQLRWSLENAYTTGCSGAGIDCTWLGFVTNPAPGSGPRGTVSVTAPALGATVTPTSPRGNSFYTFGFPFASAGSSGDVFTGGAQSFEFEGTINFVSPLPPDGHGITMTIENPRVELAGNGTGALFASGVKAAGVGTTAPYDRTQPVFDLDLASAAVDTAVDGTQTVTGIVPSIHATDYAFPSNYATGAGPNRTPNTFGAFSLVLNSPEGGSGQPGPQGPAGVAGPAGPAGRTVTVVRRIQVVYLARTPFGKGAHEVQVLRKGKVVGRGRVKGSTLRVRLTKAAGADRRLKGRYVLRVVGGKGRAVVRLG